MAVNTWQTAGSGTWSTGSNWTNGTPVAGTVYDFTFVPPNANTTVSLIVNSQVVQSFLFQAFNVSTNQTWRRYLSHASDPTATTSWPVPGGTTFTINDQTDAANKTTVITNGANAFTSVLGIGTTSSNSTAYNTLKTGPGDFVFFAQTFNAFGGTLIIENGLMGFLSGATSTSNFTTYGSVTIGTANASSRLGISNHTAGSTSAATQTFTNTWNVYRSFQVGAQWYNATTNVVTLAGTMNLFNTIQASPITISSIKNNTEISANITGSSGITFSGGVSGAVRTITLSGSNSGWTGDTRVGNDTTLSVTGTNSMASSVLDWLGATGATFTPTSNINIGGVKNTSGTPTLTLSVALNIGSKNTSESFSGSLAGAGTITKVGTGNWTLSGSSARTSATTNINAGAIQLNSANGLYAAGATGTTTVSSGAALFLNGNFTTPSSTPLSITGTGISLTGSLRNLAGNNTYAGTITLSGPARIHADAGSLTVSNLNLNSQTVTLSGGGTITVSAASSYGKIVVAGTAVLSALSIASLDGTGTVSGNATIASAGQWASGNGAGGQTLSITGSLTTSGATTLVSGGVSGGVASKVAVTGAINTGGVVTVKGSGTGWTSGVSRVVATYGSGTPNVSTTAGTWNDSANPRIGNGTVSSSAGQITLTPAAIPITPTWNGGDSGVWVSNGTAGWIFNSISTNFLNGEGVIFNAEIATTNVTLNSNVSVGSMTITRASGNTSRSIVISGSGTITNSGTLDILDATVTGYTQSVTLGVAGTHGVINLRQTNTSDPGNLYLYINNPNALGGTAQINITSDITFGDVTVFFQAGANGLSTSRNVYTFIGAPTVFNVAANTQVTFSGTITNYRDGGGLSFENFTKTGSGTLVLTGVSDYTRGFGFTEGTLEINNVANSGSPSAIGTFSGYRPPANATLRYTGPTASTNRNSQINGWLEASGTGTLTLTGTITANTRVGLSGTSTGIISSAMSGTFGVTKDGTGTWTLSNTNTHTGVTTLLNGILSVGTIGNGGVAGNLGQATNAAANIVFNGGTLRYTGTASSTDRNFTLTGNGTIDASGSGHLTWSGVPTIASGAKTLTLSGTGLGTMSGVLGNSSGTLAITKSGTGTWTLSNANTYSGGTSVTNGKVACSATGTVSGTNIGAKTSANVVTIESTGTVEFTANDVVATVQNLTSGSSLPSFVVNGGTLHAIRYNGLGNVTLASGSLTQASTDASTYRGWQFIGTVISSGTSAISSSNSCPNHLNGAASNTFTVTSGTLTVSTVLIDGSPAQSGAGAIVKNGAGEMVFSAANTYTGGTTISVGKLTASKKTALGTGPVTLAGTLQVTDTTTDPSKVISTGSFTAQTGARLIIGA